MEKTRLIVYTSNLPEMPKDMSDVIKFAQNTPKFYIANVELNSFLGNVKTGDKITTKKGNVLYVIRAYQTGLEGLGSEDREYLERLDREYRLKNVSITSVENVTKFEVWCKSAKTYTTNNTENSKEKKMKNNSIKGLSARIKEMYMPVEAEGIRVSINGDIAVSTANGYVAINANNELVSYPEEMTLDFPVYTIAKPKEQLAVGDIIQAGNSYAKVTRIEGDKICATSYTGTGKVIHTIKDFLFNTTNVRVVVSLAGMTGNQINPMMLMALSSEGGDKESLLPLLMMTQAGGNVGMNPMMTALLMGGEKSSLKDILLMSALTGNNLFGAAPQAAPQPVTKVAKRVKPASKKARSKKASDETTSEAAE